MTVPQKPSSIAKQTLDTKYHIDYDWWTNPGDLRTYLLSHLPAEYREHVSQQPEDKLFDYIDPATGRVTRADPLNFALKAAAEDPAFINRDIAIVDCLFRALLMSENEPMSSRELAVVTGYDSVQILRLLSGKTVYKGIRPFIV